MPPRDFAFWAKSLRGQLIDFPKCLRHTTPGMFADDTYLTTAHEDISTIECSLNSDLTAVHNWL